MMIQLVDLWKKKFRIVVCQDHNNMYMDGKAVVA